LLEPKLVDVIEIICKRLRGKDIRWVVDGSLALFFHGVKIPSRPQDIDLNTDEMGAYRINEVLKEYEIRAVKWKKTEHIASHFGVFMINDIRVEVMGDLRIWNDDVSHHCDMKYIIKKAKTVNIKGQLVRLMPLEESLIGYMLLERNRRVDEIKDYLMIHRANQSYLQEIIKRDKLPSSIVSKINLFL